MTAPSEARLSEAELLALEQKARKATSGPWEVDPQDEGCQPLVVCSEDGCPLALMENDGGDETMAPNAAFIAACSPDVILRLIAQARAAESKGWQPPKSDRESAWLIERNPGGQAGHAEYWSPSHVMHRAWTNDPHQAVRFARREDAERVATAFNYVGKWAAQAVEHVWFTDVPAPPAAPLETK